MTEFFKNGTLLRKNESVRGSPVGRPGYYLVLEVRLDLSSMVWRMGEWVVRLLHEDGNIRTVYYPVEDSRYLIDWEVVNLHE